MYNGVTIVATRVNLKSSHRKKETFLKLCVVMNVNYYCGAHFVMYTDVKPLCLTPEMNTVLFVNYLSEIKTEQSPKFHVTRTLHLRL